MAWKTGMEERAQGDHLEAVVQQPTDAGKAREVLQRLLRSKHHDYRALGGL